MLTAPIILKGALDHTSGLLSNLFMPLYVVQGNSLHVVFVLPLSTNGFKFWNLRTQAEASLSGPDHTRLISMRCY